MQRSGDKPLKALIDKLVDDYRLKTKFNEIDMINAWNSQLAGFIAQRTTKIYLSGNTLYVHLNSASLRQELSLDKNKIVRMLNNYLGKEVIEEIVFR